MWYTAHHQSFTQAAHAIKSRFLPARKLDTIFGQIVITEPVLRDLLDSPALKRLPNIDQHGTLTYFAKYPTFDRYAHSIGILALAKRYNLSLKEQIAGLLHDVSHTAFSHLGDHIFDEVYNPQESEAVHREHESYSYQDSIHNWYLEKVGLDKILARYNLTVHDINHENKEFSIKTKLPNLGLDRIEYNIHTGLVFGFINKQEIEQMLNHLKCENGVWFFTSAKYARQFADMPLYFTQNFWGSAENHALNIWFKRVLKRALELEILTFDDIHFKTDQYALDKVVASKDRLIRKEMDKCLNPDKYYAIISADSGQEYDLITYPKFRGIDPLVKQKDKLVLLTDIDPVFKKEFHRVKRAMKNGVRIKCLGEGVHEL